MTTQAMIAVAILIFTVILLFNPKLPRAVGAVTGAVLMILFQITDAGTVFKQFAGDTIVLMFGMMVVGGALFETGMAAHFGKVLTKITGRSETGIVLAILVFGAVVSAFVTANSAFFMFLPVVVSLALAAGLSVQRVIWPFSVALHIGQMITLVGGNGNLISQNFLLEMGYEGWGFFELTPYAVLLFLVGTPAILFIVLKFLVPDRDFKPSMADVGESDFPEKINGKMATSGIILLAVMIVMIINPKWCPQHLTAVIGALACMFTGCLNQKQALKAVDFNCLFMVAGMTGIAKAFQSTGILESLFTPMLVSLGKTSPYLVIIAIYLFAAIMPQFMNNSALVTILTPIALTLATPMGIPAKALAGIVLVGSYSCNATPMATGTSAATIEIGGYSIMEWFKMGLFQLAYSIVAALIYIFIFIKV